MTFVDTNYLLRFLLEDTRQQHKIAKKLFLDAASGTVKVFTSAVVIFEIYWVLTSFYEKNRREIAHLLKQIFSLGFLEIENKDFIVKAINLYEATSFDLEDAFNLIFAKSKKAENFATFDEKLAKKFTQIS